MIDQQFIKDIKSGLSASPKHLKSKYFYDDAGSDLFRQIMQLPEYYLTRSELEIFTDKSEIIIRSIGAREFNIIELGAGDGYKTREFLRALEKNEIKSKYYPVDISQEALDQLLVNMAGIYPLEKIELHNGDYFVELEKVFSSNIMEVVLFLGSNIGNYEADQARELLNLIGGKIKTGDISLIGADLKKDPRLIASAYNDSQGVTKAFNLNLLHRINRELGGDFNINNFEFYSHYNPASGEVKSYLISLLPQKVKIAALDQSFSFTKDELIYTEMSKKYSIEEISALALATGFKLIDQITDSKEYFAEFILERQ